VKTTRLRDDVKLKTQNSKQPQPTIQNYVNTILLLKVVILFQIQLT
jgi:hypothetical protein